MVGANRLKFTPGRQVRPDIRLRDGNLTIYNVASRTEYKRILIGHGAAGILVAPDGSRAFIACGPDNYIAVLDLKTFLVTAHIEAGGGAGRVGLGLPPSCTLMQGRRLRSQQWNASGNSGKPSEFILDICRHIRGSWIVTGPLNRTLRRCATS